LDNSQIHFIQKDIENFLACRTLSFWRVLCDRRK